MRVSASPQVNKLAWHSTILGCTPSSYIGYSYMLQAPLPYVPACHLFVRYENILSPSTEFNHAVRDKAITRINNPQCRQAQIHQPVMTTKTAVLGMYHQELLMQRARLAFHPVRVLYPTHTVH